MSISHKVSSLSFTIRYRSISDHTWITYAAIPLRIPAIKRNDHVIVAYIFDSGRTPRYLQKAMLKCTRFFLHINWWFLELRVCSRRDLSSVISSPQHSFLQQKCTVFYKTKLVLIINTLLLYFFKAYYFPMNVVSVRLRVDQLCLSTVCLTQISRSHGR